MTKCGYIALIGEPNAGKSTLLNALVGAKLAIVTHKVQTTRTRIRGIALEGDAQMIFIDTPGLFKPRRGLDRAMISAAWSGAEEADVVGLLIEANRCLTDGVKLILERLKEVKSGAPVLLLINKIDKVKAEKLLELSQKLNDVFPFVDTYMISAEHGHGLPKLRKDLADKMPEDLWLYPEDQIADMPIRMIAAEITREKLMLRLHEELPYQLTVENEKWEDRKDGSIRIDQLIYVSRDGHKGIVLGKGGETIKAVSQASRAEISEFLGQTVHLFLQVKVDEKWMASAERFENMGLDLKASK